MTLDFESVRAQFPASVHTIHLNHAGVSPLSVDCAAAMELQIAENGGRLVQRTRGELRMR